VTSEQGVKGLRLLPLPAHTSTTGTTCSDLAGLCLIAGLSPELQYAAVGRTCEQCFSNTANFCRLRTDSLGGPSSRGSVLRSSIRGRMKFAGPKRKAAGHIHPSKLHTGPLQHSILSCQVHVCLHFSGHDLAASDPPLTAVGPHPAILTRGSTALLSCEAESIGS